MKNYPHIVAKVFREPWLINAREGAAIVQLVLSRMEGQEITVEVEAEPAPEATIDGTMAVIPVHGIIGKHLSSLETMCGGCDLDRVGAMIDEAESSGASTILFDFRSPGGTVTGVPEMARRIGRLEQRTVAFTDSQCCSGALYLASQCKEFYATETAEVGSVGVWCAYFDYSMALHKEGVNVQEISAGKYKTMGAYWKPLTTEERGILQAQVDRLHAEFKAAVTSTREIDAKHLEGQIFNGSDAAQIGMVDGLVEDMAELLPADD